SFCILVAVSCQNCCSGTVGTSACPASAPQIQFSGKCYYCHGYTSTSPAPALYNAVQNQATNGIWGLNYFSSPYCDGCPQSCTGSSNPCAGSDIICQN